MTDAEAIERLAEAVFLAIRARGPGAPALWHGFLEEAATATDCQAGWCAHCVVEECRRAASAVLAALASPDIPPDVAGRLAGVRPVAEYRTAEEWHPWDGADRYMQTRTRLVRVAPEREDVRDA